MPLKSLAAIFLAARLCLTIEIASAEETTVSFKISPDGPQLTPSLPATLTLSLETPGLTSTPDSVVVRLDAPAAGFFFSTDFPAVEGSRLLEARLPIIEGKAEWRQVLPIRGEYRLTAYFTNAAGVNAEKAFTFRVHENRRKWLVLGVFSLGLFLIGMIAGRIFSGSGKEKGLEPRILLALCLMCCGTRVDAAWLQENHRGKYAAKLAISPPSVGRPAHIRWWLSAEVEGRSSASLSLSITHMEKNTVVFSIGKIPVTGEFSLNYQFTDGSDYRISAIAVTNDGETVRQEQVVSVSAVAPPWRAQLPALAFFLFVILAGLLAGRWSRRERFSAEKS